ncbi:hypothetical protein [Salinibaculum salinum]|uniref:hypothetical protein n=1 Tax=Salinibaculum salinum TaxID=3131996 RepID=UPI0030ED5376
MSPSTEPTPTAGTVTDGRVGPPALDERPDDVFAVVTGLYAALLVAPLVTAGVTRVVGDPAVLYLVFLGGLVFTVAVAAIAVRRIRGLPVRLGSTRKRWLPALVAPGTVAVAGAILVGTGQYSSADGLLGTVAAVGGFAAGGILGIMARSRYSKAITELAESHATWRAAWSDRRRRPMQLLGALGVAGGIVAFGVPVVWNHPFLQPLANVLIPMGAVVFTFGQARTYHATSAGLEQQMPAARALYEWDHFEGYTVAEDAIVLHRRAPWRLPLIYDRDDIDDEEAVVSALDQYLPRLPVA